MTGDKAYQMIEELKEVFDIVRLVDASKAVQYAINPKGELTEEVGNCYSLWNRKSRCDNCISSKVLLGKAQMTKFEFINDDMYFVTSKYVEIDDKPYMLEMVSRIQNNDFLGAYGKEEFSQKLESYSWKNYLDPITGVHNHTYYEEQVATLDSLSAIAMIDIDSFKMINENYGEPIGNKVLQLVANAICSCVRKTDIIVRYDNDEFVLAFDNITYDIFKERLEQIRHSIEQVSVEGYPGIQLTVSIGGYYVHIMSSDILEKAKMLLCKAKEIQNTVVIEE